LDTLAWRRPASTAVQHAKTLRGPLSYST
jgi:hypothetical protein